jgi:hypothetical protein
MKIFGLPVTPHFVQSCVDNIPASAERLHEERYAAAKRVSHWTFDDFERAVLNALRNPEAHSVTARDALVWATIMMAVSGDALVCFPRARLELIAARGDGRALFDIHRLCHAEPSGESFTAVLGLSYNSTLIDDYLHWALSHAIVRHKGITPYIEWENEDADADAEVSPA